MIIDLMVLNMLNFNIILGMDFWSRYKAKINCKKKKVQCYLDNGEKFTFGEGHVLNMMASSIKAKKMLSNGCI